MWLLVKWILVIVLMAGGTLFLAQGIGIETMLKRYEPPETHDLPVGALLLGTGFCLAAFWEVRPGGRRLFIDDITPDNSKVIKVERRSQEPGQR